ncbi:MAG: hypothetical protein Q9190_006061, partial [Brigantiaea leucoxantha]
MGLEELPLEIFQDHVASCLSKRDLCLLSMTSHFIRSAVEPLLYGKISWSWRKDMRKHPPIHLLIRAILNRPELAFLIKTLELRGSKPRKKWRVRHWRGRHLMPAGPPISIWEAEDKTCLDPKEVCKLERLFRSFHRGPTDLWDQSFSEVFSKGVIDLFVAILLFQLSNLRCLILESDFQFDTSFVTDVLRHEMGSNPTHGFHSLQTVIHSSDITSDFQVRHHGVDLDQVLPLLSAANIKSLDISLPPLELSWPRGETPISSITSLTLRHTGLMGEDLGQLLRATPSLQSLEYHFHYDVDFRRRPGRSHQDLFDCEQLDKSLTHVYNTLTKLILSIRFSSVQSDVDFGGFRGMKGRCTSLRHLTKLETLEIPILMLFGWEPDPHIMMGDLLPSALQTLSLTDDLYELEDSDWPDERLLDLIGTYL